MMDAATSDPSVALSTYSFERRNPNFEENTELYPETIVNSVTLTDGIYEVNTEDGQTFQSKVQPLLAAGFDGSHKFVFTCSNSERMVFPPSARMTNQPLPLNVSLPSVRHDGHVFCFIYKYRQRFAIVANAIASSLEIDTEEFVAAYRSWGMYLDDLSCCGQECLTC